MDYTIIFLVEYLHFICAKRLAFIASSSLSFWANSKAFASSADIEGSETERPQVQSVLYATLFQNSNHLNTGLVWYSNGDLKTGLKKPDYGPKCPVFKSSANRYRTEFSPVLNRYSNNRPFDDPTTFDNSNIRLIRRSDPYCIIIN